MLANLHGNGAPTQSLDLFNSLDPDIGSLCAFHASHSISKRMFLLATFLQPSHNHAQSIPLPCHPPSSPSSVSCLLSLSSLPSLSSPFPSFPFYVPSSHFHLLATKRCAREAASRQYSVGCIVSTIPGLVGAMSVLDGDPLV